MLVVGELYNAKINEWLFADKKSYFYSEITVICRVHFFAGIR